MPRNILPPLPPWAKPSQQSAHGILSASIADELKATSDYRRFAERAREIGDHKTAVLLERIAQDAERHVRDRLEELPYRT